MKFFSDPDIKGSGIFLFRFFSCCHTEIEIFIHCLTEFLFYILCGYLYFYIAGYLLKPFPEIRKYYRKRWAAVALLPFYNFAVFFIRFAGIINSMNTKSSWKTETLTREWDKFMTTMRSVFRGFSDGIKRFRHSINYEDRYNE